MSKRTSDELSRRKELQHHGWQVEKTDKIEFNGGSETDRHFICKAQVGWYLSQQGYRIDSEVVNDAGTAEADIVAYGNEEPPFVVEVETGITEEIKGKKLDQYHRNEPFVEVHILEVNDMPEERGNQLRWIQEQLGGSL